MPCISQFHGIDIYMYFNDHAPPHYHAYHGEDEVLIEFNPPKVYVGGLPKKALKRVLQWAALHPAELAADWQLARTGQPLRLIARCPKEMSNVVAAH